MSESAYRIGASFLREFFAGSDLVGNLIKNYPNRSVEELQMLESLRDTLDKFFQPMQSLFRKFDEHGGFPDSYLNNLKQLGLFGLIIPEKYGGLGLSAWGYGKVIEAVSYYDASTAVMLGAHSSIGLRGIIMYGSEEQKLKYLPSLASGDKIACFCLTEPESGSDAANLRTTAVKSGGDWIVNGQKIWITNSPFADIFTVFARTNSEGGAISAFILERGDLGLTVGQPENKMGIRASKTASVFFENVRVPGDRLLGEEGKGFKIAMTILNNGRTGLAGGSVGGMRRMYEMALSHASTRVQFGKKLIEFDIIKEKLLRMRAFIYAVQSMQEVVSWLIDSGGDCALEAAVLKVFSTDALWEVSNEALQIAGGNGYMKDYEYERFVRDARINRIFEGSNEILRLFISLNGFKALSEKFANLRSVSKFYEDPIKGFGLLVNYLRGPRITFEYDMLSELSSMILFYQNIQKKIFKTFCKVAFREGGNIVGKQMISLRVSEIVIWLFSVCCSMARYFKEENKGNLPILEYLSHIATSNIELNLKFLEKDETSLIRKWFN